MDRNAGSDPKTSFGTSAWGCYARETRQAEPMHGPSPDEAEPALVLAFARKAACCGWSDRTLRAFCRENAISDVELNRRWPKGVRSLGRELNAHADGQTRAASEASGPRPLSRVLMHRFETNEPLKDSVRRLAMSDLVHPIDTVGRTTTTAALFLRCSDAPPYRSRVELCAQTAILVLLYSVAVLVWLSDKPPTYERLRAAVRLTARALGAS